MLRHSANTTHKVRAVMTGLFVTFATICFLSQGDYLSSALSQTRQPAASKIKPKYSEFPHDVKAHKMECASCHKFPTANWNKVRAKDTAFPDITDYPKHESCLNCHRQQFFKGARPVICSICHTNPSPRDSSRHPFPNPREIFDTSAKGKQAVSDFAVYFPHDKHIDIVSTVGAARSLFRNASFTRSKLPEESCSVCHTTLNPQGDSDVEYVTKPPADLGEGFWLKKGTFKSTPTGHTACFTCHSQDSGLAPAPSDCAACHKFKQIGPPADFDATLAAHIGVTDRITLDQWRRRDSSGKFRHEWFSHSELSCSTCHNVETMGTTDWRTKKVAVSSCSTCHATPTSDDGGAINFEIDSKKADPAFQCTKCHIIFGTKPVPESHLKAIAAAAGK